MNKVVKDQMGRKVNIPGFPERIVSLVPSQTELLFDLGMDQELVGVTKFCVHPLNKVKSKKKVGGTKKFDFKAIKELNPDLIIGNKEENYREGIEELEKYFSVWMSDIRNLGEALDMILKIGIMVNKTETAYEIHEKIKSSLFSLNIKMERRALYLIWRNPFMSVGGETFINQMMEIAGFKNILNSKSRYPQIKAEEISSFQPDYILLSSEPYPFKEKHIEEFKELSPSSQILLVDGEMFSWYGSRLLHAAIYFQSLKNI